MRFSGSNPRATIDTIETGGRIYDLRTAAKAFASTVLDPVYEGQVSLTIVPYAGHTNPGQEMFEIINAGAAPGDGSDNFTIPFDAMLPGVTEKVGSLSVGIPITRVEYDEVGNRFVLVVNNTLESIPSIVQ